MTVVLALGDSFSCGEGVGVRTPPGATWSALLAAALPATAYRCLARPGARAGDVLAQQVPAAVAARPDLATLLVGLNDVCRAGFDADAVATSISASVSALRAAGAQVLVARLHDPTDLLPLPVRLRGRVRARVAAVNAAIDGAFVLDLAGIPALRTRAAWAVDRLHPSAAGHAAIARAAAQALGPLVHGEVVAPEGARSPGPVREAAWVLRHGLPYLALHGRRVLAPTTAG